ncbi:hypothetical protein [Desulfosporosinus lacus]|uniref:Uncharacterized protein n=1 Tax=Desulfosporosinus lacus DSM 15449 TaxID=1121420 RepID=A0A1M5ZSL6_9FIRM|nr:hypothetical protein [Desulfosporosinus lacus]SHI27202.1 hypothetical protein SAMN02746098_03632 [Desulfosporosinus lacus DSM 15449]
MTFKCDYFSVEQAVSEKQLLNSVWRSGRTRAVHFTLILWLTSGNMSIRATATILLGEKKTGCYPVILRYLAKVVSL